MSIIFIGFRDMNDSVNLGICKHDFKFTCRGAAEAIADLPSGGSLTCSFNGKHILKLIPLGSCQYVSTIPEKNCMLPTFKKMDIL